MKKIPKSIALIIYQVVKKKKKKIQYSKKKSFTKKSACFHILLSLLSTLGWRVQIT